MKLQKEIAHLKEENQYLRMKLQEQHLEADFPCPELVAPSPPSSITKRGRHMRSGALSDEKAPPELRGIEKYFSKDVSKDFVRESSGLSVFGNFQVFLSCKITICVAIHTCF